MTKDELIKEIQQLNTKYRVLECRLKVKDRTLQCVKEDFASLQNNNMLLTRMIDAVVRHVS